MLHVINVFFTSKLFCALNIIIKINIFPKYSTIKKLVCVTRLRVAFELFLGIAEIHLELLSSSNMKLFAKVIICQKSLTFRKALHLK